MPPKESLYPADWLKIAEKDFVRVHQLLNVKDPEATGFYLQQAIEKFIKAYLLNFGWQLKRIHDLEALLNDAIHYDPEFEDYRAVCQKITGFYFLERYPLLTESGISEKDVNDALSQVDGLIRKVQEIIK